MHGIYYNLQKEWYNSAGWSESYQPLVIKVMTLRIIDINKHSLNVALFFNIIIEIKITAFQFIKFVDPFYEKHVLYSMGS